MTICYNIYSHFDFDGAVAALLLKAMLADHMAKNFPSKKDELQVQVQPVDHASIRQSGSVSSWDLTPLSGPCAVLDFSLHPLMLSDKFYDAIDEKSHHLGLQNFWIDHHATGAAYPFLTPENIRARVPSRLTVLWDPASLSTPGLMRAHRKELRLSDETIVRYEKLIDLCEIADGALFLSASDAANFDHLAVQLQALFSTHHPLIVRNKLYCALIDQLLDIEDGHFGQFLNFDPIYSVIIDYERRQHLLRFAAYQEVLQVGGEPSQVAVADFRQRKELWQGFGRFVPYELAPECTYAIHISPANAEGVCSITCGRNPWKRTQEEFAFAQAACNSGGSRRDLATDSAEPVPVELGKLFAGMFLGGGHQSVAGGTIREHDHKLLQDLIFVLSYSKAC